ncbi:MAG: RNA methyltransferase, partial [Candidatus Micrarchaeota archaeon]
MAEFKIILVGSEYPINLGYCARVLANFGYTEMNLVKPKVKIGKTALMHSKHGRELLEKAKVYESLKAATLDCDFVVGTSGITKRGNKTLRSPINLEKFCAMAEKSGKKFAILFGREGTGLSAEEIRECDFLVSIPASTSYPILNLSHAL